MPAHGELLRQQLVELDASPRGERASAESFRVRSRARMMQRIDGLAESAHPESLGEVFGQGVIERGAGQSAFDQSPQRSLSKA